MRAALVLCLAVACAPRADVAQTAAPSGSVVVVPVSGDPRSAPDHVVIDGRSYRVGASGAASTYFWRDFMPIAPPDGRPLTGSIRVVADDDGAFPAAITADRVLVYGPSVWDTAPAEVRRAPDAGTPSSQIEVVVRDGPKWDPGTKIDVVVQLRAGSATYLVRASGITIERTS